MSIFRCDTCKRFPLTPGAAETHETVNPGHEVFEEDSDDE